MFGRLLKAPVKIRRPTGLIESAWRVADELGWAKTYDAQYVALAQMLDCQLVSVDEKMGETCRRANRALMLAPTVVVG